MFITFTNKYEHFIDNIKNGYLLNEHKVQFLPSTSQLIGSLLKFWDEYDIKSDTISKIRDLRDKHKGVNILFWSELASKMESNFKFNSSVSLLLGQFNSAPIKMKCFTEIRDNQKLDPSHTGYFGEYGIQMKESWMLSSGGCPVIYVNKSMNLTNILARNMSIMQTLDNCVKTFTKIRSLSINGAFFDLISFVETSDHRYEYEWRIASGHKLGGYSFLPQLDRLKFELADVHAFFVPDELAINETNQLLASISNDSDYIPKVYLTSEILLSNQEIERIRKIKERKTH